MFIYAVTLRGASEGEDFHIRDRRAPKAIARDLVKDGFLVSEAVAVRSAFTAYDDAQGNAVRQDFFSADALGACVLLAQSVASLVEHPVPKNAQPMPDPA